MSDIVFDDTEQIDVLCENLNVQGHDFLLGFPGRLKPDGPRFRRALVHNEGDGLTLNFTGDYPGGVTINDVRTLEVTGDLRFRISHHDELLLAGGNPPDETVLLADVIKTLRRELSDLQTQVAKLAARP